jgi:hypothetical protein
MLAIVAVLAWASRPATSVAQQLAPQAVLVKGANGKSHLVVVKSSAHATTSTSAAAALRG